MEAKNSFDLDRLIGRLREKARRKIPEAEVEDIVQEVLVVLVEKMRTERVEALHAYAEGILRHMIYDYYQKRKEHLSDLEQCDLESAEPSPEQRVVFMRHLRVIQGLAEENQIDNALVHRHFSEGAPLREVASELGVSAGAVNGRLYRFRQKVLKQVGNCFAFLFAIFTGLWGRAARAYVGSRPFAATAALIGIFSVGSFFSGLWNQLKTPSLTNMLTQQRTRHVNKTSDDDILRLFRMAPEKARPTTGARPAALKVTANVPYKPVAPFVWIDGRDALSMDNTFVDSIHTPSFAAREHTRSKANMPLRAVFQQYFETNGRRHTARSSSKTQATAQTASQHAVLQLAAAAHVATPSATTGSKATQPSAGQTSTNQTAPSTGQDNTTSTSSPQNPPNGTSSKTPTSGSSGQVGSGTVTTPTKGGTINNNGTPTLADPKNTEIKAGNPTGVTTPNTGKPVTGTQAHSFCVVQDGHVYDCSDGKMDDISGDVNDKFGCGTSIGCKDMIANGPSLVFTKDGLMYVAGEGRLHFSKDGGHSWSSATTKMTATQLLSNAVMILSQKGTVWSSNGQSWKQLRAYRPDVHEVRLHLKEGRIDVEDDTGFKANMTWKDQLSRQPTTSAGTVATPTNSKAGGTLLPAAGTNVAPKLPGISNGTGDDPFPKTPVVNPLR